MSEQQDNLTPDEQEQADFAMQPPIDPDPDEGLESFDTDPALEEQMVDPNAETRDQADALNQSLNPAGMMDTFNQPGAGNNDPGLNFGLPDMPSAVPLVDPFDHAFPMRMLSFTSGTGGKWVERITSGTSMVDFAEGRFVSSITSAAGAVLVGIGETDFVSVEQIDPDGYHYPAMPSGIVDCYLTDLGGGSYDGYLDAAKTIQIFAAQTGTQATAGATKGLARLVGKSWRFITPLVASSTGSSVIFSKTASGDTIASPTANFATVTPSISSYTTPGTVLRLTASIIESGSGTHNKYKILTAGNEQLGITCENVLSSGGGFLDRHYIALDLEITIVSSTILIFNHHVFNGGGASAGFPQPGGEIIAFGVGTRTTLTLAPGALHIQVSAGSNPCELISMVLQVL